MVGEVYLGIALDRQDEQRIGCEKIDCEIAVLATIAQQVRLLVDEKAQGVMTGRDDEDREEWSPRSH